MSKAGSRYPCFIFVTFYYPVAQESSNQLTTSQSEIMSKPELFVEPDPELPLALLDQKEVLFIFINKFSYCSMILTLKSTLPLVTLLGWLNLTVL